MSTNRKRNKAVTVRMSDSEYKAFRKRVDESGLLQQSYIISSLLGAPLLSQDAILELQDLSLSFASLCSQLRGLSTNVNQMAHVANGQGRLPVISELEKVSNELAEYRKENEALWRSIRSLTTQQKATGL